jgi:plasmid maintenance system antidote protein VapI
MKDLTTNPKVLARELREALGVSAAHASELARGIKSPSFNLAIDIQDRLGIEPRWWRDNLRGKVQ